MLKVHNAGAEKGTLEDEKERSTSPDDIPPAFLKELGPRALGVLLDIFNESFALAECPQIWRLAIIVPLLKAGKSPKELKSFRPITSPHVL